MDDGHRGRRGHRRAANNCTLPQWVQQRHKFDVVDRGGRDDRRVVGLGRRAAW
jgi:hypothetical protein